MANDHEARSTNYRPPGPLELDPHRRQPANAEALVERTEAVGKGWYASIESAVWHTMRRSEAHVRDEVVDGVDPRDGQTQGPGHEMIPVTGLEVAALEAIEETMLQCDDLQAFVVAGAGGRSNGTACALTRAYNLEERLRLHMGMERQLQDEGVS